MESEQRNLGGGTKLHKDLFFDILRFGVTIFLVAFFFACDTVEEKPGPDRFAQNSLLTVEANSDSAGEAVLDILEVNNLKESFRVSFTQPNKGHLVPEGVGAKFRYKAIRGYSGLDSFRYQLCRTSLCKSGQVRVNVKQPPLPCVSSFDASDTYREIVNAAPEMTVRLHPGDFLCLNSILAKGSSQPSTQWSVDTAGIHFSMPNSNNKADFDLVFTYHVFKSNSSTERTTRICTVSVKMNSEYCNSIFKVLDFSSYTLLGQRGHAFILDRMTTLSKVTCCYNSLDETFYHAFASQSEAKITPLPNGKYAVYPSKPSNSKAQFHFVYRNKLGLSDTGLGKIKFED